MAAISIADIVAGKPRLRTKTVNYGDALVFELKTFTAVGFRKLADGMADHTDDDNDDHSIEVAIKFIEGEDYEPTKAEIKAFKDNLDLGVIQRLVIDGLRFNRGAEDIAEAAKKS